MLIFLHGGVMHMINDLNRSIEKIHNYIYANDGLNNFEVLDELLKILYLKVYDENNLNLLTNSDSDETLLNKAKDVFKSLTAENPNLFEKSAKINLKNSTLIYVLRELSNFSISKMDQDLKGHLMQRIIDRSFREGRGQFFTPIQVVDFMVNMLSPKSGSKCCDPACGTGGFMFKTIEYMSRESNNTDFISNIDFYDISKSITKLVMMRYMFEFGKNNPNIKVQDSLTSEIPQIYDYVLTNPPFGSQGRIADKSILEKYILGSGENGKPLNSQVPDILFIEKVIRILKNGGKGAIVLPDGNFENPSSRYIREFIVNNCRVDAIVSLPDGTFIPYGTGVKSSILFFTKGTNVEQNYNVFFGKINNLGYTFSKHSKTLLNKSGEVIEDYSKVLEAYKTKNYDDDNFVINVGEIIKNNYNFAYHFYSKRINKAIEQLTKNSTIRLKDLVLLETKKEKIDPDTKYKYIEISDVSSSGCEITGCSILEGSELPSRASYKLKENEVIVAIAGNAIGTIWQAKAIVPKEYDGSICTNGFMVVTSKKISPYIILHFFNSDAFRMQILKYKYGTAIPTVSRDDFLNIIVPNYSEDIILKIIQNTEKAFKLKAEAKKLLDFEADY